MLLLAGQSVWAQQPTPAQPQPRRPIRARVQPEVTPSIRGLLGLRSQLQDVQDSNDFVVLDTVVFEGQQKTLPIAMLREMNVRLHDTLILREVPGILERNRQLLYNTGLFNKVEARYDLKGRSVVFYLSVVERWYIIPSLVFQVEERTVWEWLKEPNTYRLSYGAGVSYRNVTGRNDRLSATFVTGFTDRYGLSYNRPFIWPSQMIGGGIGAYYQENTEVISGGSSSGPVERTRNSGNSVFLQTGGDINFTKRITQNNGMNLTLGYTYYAISDSILLDNPRYLSSEGRVQDQFARIRYELWWDSRDVRAFPLTGHRFSLQTEFVGLGLGTTNFGRVSARGFRYGDTPWPKLYWAAGGSATWMWGGSIPFPEKATLQTAPVRGFENYVIDGTFFVNLRGELRYELVKRQIVTLRWLPRQFEDFLTGVYPYVFVDSGYNEDKAYNRRNNRFNNQVLASYGVGVDIPYIYDNLLRAEYAMTNYGTGAFLLQFSFALQ